MNQESYISALAIILQEFERSFPNYRSLQENSNVKVCAMTGRWITLTFCMRRILDALCHTVNHKGQCSYDYELKSLK